jgi:hypothetical protein
VITFRDVHHLVPRLLLLLLVPLGLLAGPSRAGELPKDWLAFESEHAVVHAPPSAERTAATLSSEVDDVVEELLSLTGLQRAPTRIQAYLAPSRDSFSSIQPGSPPEWAAGTAYPERSLLFVCLETHGQKSPRQVFVHEVTHVVLHWSYGESEPPRWLEEGLAQVVAGEFDLQTQVLLSRAALGGGLIPLSSLVDRWPRQPGRARVAYAQSRDFVLFVRHRHGDEALAVMIERLAAGGGVEDALLAATGEPLAELEDRWRGRLKRRYAWLPVIGGSGSAWSLAAVLLVIGWARKRRIKHQRLAQMAEAEARVDEVRQRVWEPDPERTPLWTEPDEHEPTVH